MDKKLEDCMVKTDYQHEMKECYANIYQDYYDFKDNVIDQARNFILRNMKDLNILPPPQMQLVKI